MEKGKCLDMVKLDCAAEIKTTVISFYASAQVTAVARDIMFSGCPFVCPIRDISGTP